MNKYKLGCIPACPPYQLEDIYTIEFEFKVGKMQAAKIIFQSKDKKECENKLKELQKGEIK